MLTSVLRALIKNSIKESFDITFIGNEKSCQNINYFFFLFPYKFSLTRFLIGTLRALISMTLKNFMLASQAIYGPCLTAKAQLPYHHCHDGPIMSGITAPTVA